MDAETRSNIIIGCSVGGGVLVLILIIACCICFQRQGRRRKSRNFDKEFRPNSNTEALSRNVNGLDLRLSDTGNQEDSRPVSKESYTFQYGDGTFLRTSKNNNNNNNNYNNRPSQEKQQRISDRSSRMTEELSSHVVAGYGQVRMKSTYGLENIQQRDSDYTLTTSIVRDSGQSFRNSNTNSGVPLLNLSDVSEHVHERPMPSVPQQKHPIKYDSSRLGLVRREESDNTHLPDWLKSSSHANPNPPIDMRRSTTKKHVISVKRTSSARDSSSRPLHPHANRTSSYRTSFMSNELGAPQPFHISNYGAPEYSPPTYPPNPYGAPVHSAPQPLYPARADRVSDQRMSGMSMDLGADFDTAFTLAGGNMYPSFHRF